MNSLLRAARKFRKAYGSPGYTYKARLNWSGRRIEIAVYAANGQFLTTI